MYADNLVGAVDRLLIDHILHLHISLKEMLSLYSNIVLSMLCTKSVGRYINLIKVS